MNALKVLLILMIMIFSLAKTNPMYIGYSVIYQVENEKWEDVNDEVKSAIQDTGVVISYTSHAKKMLDRTAKSIGLKQDTYANAQIHLFCKASLSHKMVNMNPHIISGCPYGISVYELKNKKNTIYVSYRKYPKDEEAYKDVIKLQKSIIEEALGL